MMSFNLLRYVFHYASNPITPCRMCHAIYAQITTHHRSLICVVQTPVSAKGTKTGNLRLLLVPQISVSCSSALSVSSYSDSSKSKCNMNERVRSKSVMFHGAKVRHLSPSATRLTPDKLSNDSGSDEKDDADVKEIKFDKDILKDDPELKSMVGDIKKDFGNISQRKKEPADNDDASKSDLGPNKLGTFSKVDLQQYENVEKDFEYDYSVAEDIEEYDYKGEDELAKQQVRSEKILPISLERGRDGVFDIEEMLTLLEDLGAKDIVSVPVPPSANYCDHMVVVSAKSKRHLQVMNEELLWIHKRKKSPADSHLRIEGLDKSFWSAMDMGNIVLHIFHGSAREYYDIESLWTLGPEKDPKCQEQGGDPYALSAEDLFWLETADSGDKSAKQESLSDNNADDVANVKHDDETASKFDSISKSKTGWEDGISDADAGWGQSRPPVK